MNNRYICKAKRKDNNEWIEGYLYITHDGEYEISKYDEMTGIEIFTCVVIPETVRRCTELKDKNGKWIFEGDVFEGNKIDGKRKLYKFWYDDDEGAFVYGISYKGGYRLSIAKWCFKSENIEVIGNIHDNPELLEVGR